MYRNVGSNNIKSLKEKTFICKKKKKTKTKKKHQQANKQTKNTPTKNELHSKEPRLSCHLYFQR